ncbi:hypothetical protein F5Y16DRAFT_305577 [Xylariaceae sp. FL0255]|nr:hypothetical protein F5Y16DRAFT_305577 [Xylariaceae sp. FL0255]
MNQATQDEINSRLEGQGLKKITLPLPSTPTDGDKTSDTDPKPIGTSTKPTDKHVPIFISDNLAAKSRIVLIFGETHQDLGVLAQRVIGGPGGVTKGSMVSIVAALQKQTSGPGLSLSFSCKINDAITTMGSGAAADGAVATDATDAPGPDATAANAAAGNGAADANGAAADHYATIDATVNSSAATAPGIVLANTGELLWWAAGKRTLSHMAFQAAPMSSAAHIANFIDPETCFVPGNASPLEHVKYIFENIVGNAEMVRPDAVIDIIGIGTGAEVVEKFLDSEGVWNKWGGRLGCFAIVGGMLGADRYIDKKKGITSADGFTGEGFKTFLKERARAYVSSMAPAGTVIANPEGNPKTSTFTKHGCPVISAGMAIHLETMFIDTHPLVLSWMQEVALAPKPYKNPIFEIDFDDGTPAPDHSPSWGPVLDPVDEFCDNGVDIPETPGLKLFGGSTGLQVCEVVDPPKQEDRPLTIAEEAAMGDKNLTEEERAKRKAFVNSLFS